MAIENYTNENCKDVFSDKIKNYPIIKANAGDILFRPGQECQGFVLVRSGIVKVCLISESGREIILYRVGHGEICLQTFGCLIKNETYSAEWRAQTDVEIEIIPHAEFHHLIANDSNFRNNVFAAVAARFKDFEYLIENVALSSVEMRLARVLLRLVDIDGNVNITHEMLASEIGSAREVVSRHLNNLARKNIVKITRGKINILKIESLKDLCD